MACMFLELVAVIHVVVDGGTTIAIVHAALFSVMLSLICVSGIIVHMAFFVFLFFFSFLFVLSFLVWNFLWLLEELLTLLCFFFIMRMEISLFL